MMEDRDIYAVSIETIDHAAAIVREVGAYNAALTSGADNIPEPTCRPSEYLEASKIFGSNGGTF